LKEHITIFRVKEKAKEKTRRRCQAQPGVVWRKTDVSEEHIASTFRAEQQE
jgi:predicted CoA-binding protein